MRYILPLLLFFSCAEQKRPLPPPPQPLAQEIVFRNVHVVPMNSDTILENQDVVAKNGVITTIGASGKLTWGSDAMVIDATGKYLLPGLAEMHAHVPPTDDFEPMKEVFLLFAVNGVTTIRGMLGHPKHLEIREKLKNGEAFGPRFVTAGPPLGGDEIKTPDDAIAAVRAQKTAGYDFLKILVPALSKEAFGALAITAEEVGMPFAGHVPSTIGVRNAIEAGYATIDHLDGFVESLVPGIEEMKWEEIGWFGMFAADKADTSKISDLIAVLRAGQTWVVPTQCLAERWFSASNTEIFAQAPEMIYMDEKTLKLWANSRDDIIKDPKFNAAGIARFNQLRQRLIYECQKNGIGLLLGSDAPQVYNVPGFSIHHELQYLVNAGLTPYEALKTGTANVGVFLKRDDIGVIKAGAVSDLILLDANPLSDISNSQKIAGVLLGKNWLSKTYIEKTLRQLEKRRG